jgi:hypothetical protein
VILYVQRLLRVNNNLSVRLDAFALGANPTVVPERHVYNLALETCHWAHRDWAPAPGHTIRRALRYLLNLESPPVPIARNVHHRRVTQIKPTMRDCGN